MARIEGIGDKRASRITRAVFRSAKRMVGKVPEPLRLMAHSRAVMWASGCFELAFGRAKAVDERLKTLASIKVATLVGCFF
jgi:alkylhydroperoxidase/carboxymuconolactone decarboxylase family protein YurZ